MGHTLDIHYFAAAKDAAGTGAETVETAATTLGELLDELTATHHGTTAAGLPFSTVLSNCSFLIDGARSDRDAHLHQATRIDVMPPFAGG